MTALRTRISFVRILSQLVAVAAVAAIFGLKSVEVGQDRVTPTLARVD